MLPNAALFQGWLAVGRCRTDIACESSSAKGTSKLSALRVLGKATWEIIPELAKRGTHIKEDIASLQEREIESAEP